MSPPSPPRDSAPDRRLLRRSLEFVRPHARTLLGVLALALVLSSLSAVDPLIMKFLFDLLGSEGDLRQFALAMGALLVAELGRALLTARLGTSSWDLRLKVEYAVRERVTAKLNALPVAYHQREGVGGLINRMNQAVMGFVAAFSELSFNVLPVLLYLGLSLAAMWRLDWQLTIAVIMFAPLPAVIGARAAPEQTQRERRLVERWSSIYSRFNEVLTGITTVKSFAMEEAEQRRFLAGVREGLDIVRNGVRIDNRNGAIRSLAGTFARLTAIGLGGWMVWRGEITLGTLVAFLGYIGGLFGPVQGLTNTYQTLRKATVALETIYGILDAEDAKIAAATGADAIIVSNHGGRQLDGTVSSIRALPEVVQAVGDRIEVWFDGGIRSGQDVLRALALGARGTMIGKSFAYGLGAMGEAGVTKVLEILQKELDVTMALCGLRDVKDASPSILRGA